MKCIHCGVEFEQRKISGQPRLTCSDRCAKERARAMRRRYYHENKNNMVDGVSGIAGNNPYIVVRDETPFGFRPGAQFHSVEIQAMLENKALTPGVILAKRNKQYIVRAQGRRLTLKRMAQ